MGTNVPLGGSGRSSPGGRSPGSVRKLPSFPGSPPSQAKVRGETKEEQQSAASEVEMPMWVWIVIGVGSFLGLSLLVGFALAAILGAIGRQISELHQTDDWAMLPPTHTSKEVEEQQPQEQAKSRVDRLTQHH